MAKNNWHETGDQIKRLVQDAVESGDFSRLGNMISDIVNDTVDSVQDAVWDNLSGKRQRYNRTYGQRAEEESPERDSGAYEQTGQKWGEYGRTASDPGLNRDMAERIRRTMQQRRETYGQSRDSTRRPTRGQLRIPGEFRSKIMKYWGYGIGCLFGLSALSTLSMSFYYDPLESVGVVCLSLLLCGVNLAIGVNGSRHLKLAQRFRRYRAILGERTYCLVEELSAGIGQSITFVRKDLRTMIRRGYFPEGYLDQKEQLLITDKETYQQYMSAEAEYAKRQAEEELRKRDASGADDLKRTFTAAEDKKKEHTEKAAEQEARGGTAQDEAAFGAEASEAWKNNPEYQEMLDEGRKYIMHIRACNDRIPEEEMSNKLDRLELVVSRIFQEAQKNPETVSDLKKMMSYYLPTTRKLLDAYCDLHDQPIRGQNIENTRREIENALDTINEAFERLLDDLFEEKAWDISSDISVLNTMLAQEGLTGNDFGKRPDAEEK